MSDRELTYYASRVTEQKVRLLAALRRLRNLLLARCETDSITEAKAYMLTTEERDAVLEADRAVREAIADQPPATFFPFGDHK